MRPKAAARGLAMVVVLGAGSVLGFGVVPPGQAEEADTVEVPHFEVDPYWPRPLPNHWILGSAVGVGVDSRDHVYVIHRRNTFSERNEIGAATDPKTSTCCIPAPNILEFSPEGELVNSFGGPSDDYSWPVSNHGLTVDHKDNIWIGGNGRGDSHILKFTRGGKFLQQIGVPGQDRDSLSTEHFGRVAKVSFDAAANEAYVSDGYANKRVVVLDADSGAFKRFWGAYGNTPDDADLGRYDPEAPPAQQFRNPIHCAEPSRDGLVYVCDRPNNRIQVFKSDGSFVMEKFVEPLTLGDGAVWDIAFSGDEAQRFIFLADGKNQKIWILERESMEILSSFGDGGRQPGQFFAVHSIVADSQGNLYTTETYEGKRVQKFVYRGLKKVPRGDQGTPWGDH